MADGLLSNIFGAIDSAKRGVSTRYNMLMDNPREYLAQIEERARESNRIQEAGMPGLLAQYSGAPVTPEQQRAAQYANQQMMDVAMGFAAPTTYHGTAHLFPSTSKNVLGEFNALKIGTGEGNQMYGYGHYLGGVKGTGQKYQKDISSDYLATPSGQLFSPESLGHINIRAELRRNPEKLNELISKAQDIASSNSGAASYAKEDLNKLLELQKSGGVSKHSGYLYTVDLPDSSARRMLDYDKELRLQPKNIRDLATKYNVDLNDLGFDLIQKVGSDAKGSEIMRAANIPGIKYLDEGSRGNFKAQTTYKGNPYGDVIDFKTKKQLDDYIVEKGKEGFGVKTFPQTSNYVVFPKNEGLLTIKKREK
jgi:hypothetical protein